MQQQPSTVTGLNKTGGTNRLRFQKLEQRVAQARTRVDVVHKIKEPVEFLLEQQDRAIDDVVGVGEGQQSVCIFREHVLKYIELNTSKAFQSLGKSLLPLCGSLPELLHHLEKVVGLLTSHIEGPWASGHDTALLLISVLAKEVGSEVYDKGLFHPIMTCLIGALDPSNPEASSRSFQTMSYIFKHLGRPITNNMDCMKRYYGPLLGHPKQYLRRYAAEALSLLLRRLEDKSLAKHLKSIIKAAATALEQGGGLQGSKEDASWIVVVCASAINKRGRDLLDGLSLLVFYTVKGLESQGQLHSCGQPVLRWLMEQEAEGKGSPLGVAVTHAVAEGAVTYLCPHLKPPHAGPVWVEATRDLARLAVTAGGGQGKLGNKAGVKRKQQQAAEEEQQGSQAGGLQRRLSIVALLICYRRGWLLTHEEVKKTQAIALARLARSMTEAKTYGTMSVEARREVIKVLLGLLEWQAQRGSGSRSASSITPEEGGLRRAVARALGVAFGPNHGLDETVMGDLAGRALGYLSQFRGAVGHKAGREADMEVDEEDDGDEEEEEEQHMVALVTACLKRWLEPSCPSSTRLSLLCAIMRSGEGGGGGGLVACSRAQLRSLGEAMTAQIKASASPSPDVLVALRCLPSVLEAFMHSSSSSGTGGSKDGKLVKEITKLVTAWATTNTPTTRRPEAGGDDTLLSRCIHGQAAMSWVRLCGGMGGELESRVKVIASLLSSLRKRPDSLLQLKALHECLQQPSPPPPQGSAGDEVSLLITTEQAKVARQALVTNLHSRSHLTRLLTLRVLASLPSLPYTEPSTPEEVKRQQQQQECPYVGPCPAMSLCLEVEELPLSVTTEKELSSRLARLEVMARSGRMPMAYMEAVATHCVGLLHVKFAIVWPLAAQIFATVAEVACRLGAGEVERMWRPVEQTWSVVNSLLLRARSDEEEGGEEDGQQEAGQADVELLGLKGLLTPAKAANEEGEEAAAEDSGWERVAFIMEVEEEELGSSSSRRAATDAITTLSSIFMLLKKSQALVVRRAKVLTSLFLSFLHTQYFALHPDDAEARELNLTAYQDEEQESNATTTDALLIPPKAARTKLVGFLDLFHHVSGARHSARIDILNRVFRAFLARPDAAVAKAALECVLIGKPPGVLPYATHLRALLDDNTLRDELVKFSLANDVQPEHRLLFIPVLVRVLFGRFLSKGVKARKRSSKDSPAARRSAIVSFLAGAQEPAEFREFVHLMLRPFLRDATQPFTQTGNLVVAGVSTPRRLGFLHLLRSVIRQMGFHVLTFVPCFIDLIFGLLEDVSSHHHHPRVANGESNVGDEDEMVEEEEEVEEEEDATDRDKNRKQRRKTGKKQQDEEDEEEDDAMEVVAATAGAPDEAGAGTEGRGRRAPSSSQTSVRPLALRTLTELVAQFSEAIDLLPYSARLWAILGPSVKNLPSMCSSATQPPSLLSLLVTLTQDSSVLPVYREHSSALTPTLISCLSMGPRSPVTSALLDIMERLLDYDGPTLILPYLPDLVHHLSLRLAKAPSSDPLLERELSLLCTTGQLAADLSHQAGAMVPDSEALSTLFSLLLPRLRTRVLREEVKVLVLGAYATLVRHMANPRRDVMQLTKLLGPAGLSVGMGPASSREKPLRESLVTALDALAATKDLKDMRPVMELVKELNSLDESVLEGRDLDRCMPVWTQLSEEGKWEQIMTSCGRVGLALLPLVSHCLASLHDEEVVIRVAAGGGLRAMVRAAAKDKKTTNVTEGWGWLLQSVVIPAVRSGLAQQADSVRQGYVMILAEVVRCGKDSSSCWFSTVTSPSSSGGDAVSSSSSFHLDLAVLQRDDEADMDFFHNVTHIQIYRRSRALQRLRQSLERGDATFSSATMVHVLLPLACQPLLSRPQAIGGKPTKAPDPTLLQEALLTVGKLAHYVSWSHYLAVLRRFLRELTLFTDSEGSSSREKALVSCLCQVLDAFHFSMAVELPSAMTIQDSSGGAKERVEEEEEEEEEGDGGEEEEEEEEEEEGDEEAEGAAVAVSPPTPRTNSVWRIMRVQILPGLRGLLLKEVKDKQRGGKIKVLRAPMALAILKIIKLLPPTDFRFQFTRLLMTVCTALRSRDSNVRDGARAVLCSMLQDLGADYLPTMLHELCMALKEGYQLHIRVFTLHALLRALAEVYTPPTTAPSHPVEGVSGLTTTTHDHTQVVVVRPGLDTCVKDMLQVLLDDIFGETAGAKESEAEVKSATIKEAKGQKALDALELLGRLILFRPTYAVTSPDDPAAVSSVHALVSPLLWQLHDSESPKTHGKVNQALQRVVNGLGNNASLSPAEVLLYVYGLITPFLDTPGQEEQEDGGDQDQGGDYNNSSDDDDSEAEDEDDAMDVGVNGAAVVVGKRKRKKRRNMQWLPTEATLKLAIDPIMQKRQDSAKEFKVRDGRHAPKLAGNARHEPSYKAAQGGMFGDPTALGAGIFGLRLLYSFLRRVGLPTDEAQRAELVALVDPYVGLLSRCIRRTVNDTIVLLSLKCLGVLLRYSSERLPSIARHGRALARKVLSLLTMAGGPANSRDELVQCCTKTLTLLLERDDAGRGGGRAARGGGASSSDLPLNTAGQRSLVSLLASAALDYDHHNATFSLIKALVSRRVLVPEVYDLMEQLAGIAVTSRRPTVRQMSSQILVMFLLDYPLSPTKLASFLQQLVLNLGYEYEEGRAAALDVLEAVTAKLPAPVLDEHSQSFFLPMMLRLVNDASPKVRARAAQAITTLLRKVSGDVFHLLLEYQVRWLDGGQAEGVARAAAQGVGLFVEARPDLVKRGDFGIQLLELLTAVLGRLDKKGAVVSSMTGNSDLEAPRERDGEEQLGWEMAYHCLSSLSAMYERLPGVLESYLKTCKGGWDLLASVSALLVYRHAWVRLAASRFMGHYLDRRNPSQLVVGGQKPQLEAAGGEYLNQGGEAWFPLMRRLCVQIDRPTLSAELSQRAVKSLVFLALALAQASAGKLGGGVVAAMHGNGVEAMHEDEEEDEDEDEGGQGANEEEEEGGRGSVPKDGLSWLMGRLAYMARRKSEDRRCAVFRFFAAFASIAPPALVSRYLPHMLSPLYRATMDGQGAGVVMNGGGGGGGEADNTTTNDNNNACELAKEVLELVEGRVGSGVFVQAYSDVQRAAVSKKEARKKARAVEAVTDPEAAAKRRMARNAAKKEGKKRKAEGFKRRRGAAAVGGGEGEAAKRTKLAGAVDRDQGM